MTENKELTKGERKTLKIFLGFLALAAIASIGLAIKYPNATININPIKEFLIKYFGLFMAVGSLLIIVMLVILVVDKIRHPIKED